MADGDMRSIGVLFVCLGNICRSPTAEGVFRKLHLELAPGLLLHVDSAGTHAYHIGETPDPRSQAAARLRGVDISGHRCRQVQAQDFKRFDYVLAMDRENLARLQQLRPKDGKAELKLLLEYATDLKPDEVPDPYYGSRGGFEEVLDLVELGGRGLLTEILRRQKDQEP